MKVDKAQYLVCLVLVAVGAFLIYDALTLTGGFAKVDPVGPRAFPLGIGIILIALALVLAVAIPRGSVGEADAGEDVEPNMPGDWRTVGLLVGLFVLVILLVKPLGWAITGRCCLPGRQRFWAIAITSAILRSARCCRWRASTRSTPGSESRCPQAFWTGFCR